MSLSARVKEGLLLIMSVVATLVLSFVLIRHFAPQLLGLPVDLKVVKAAESVPPFFQGVFRSEDYQSDNFLISDPYILRAKPLLGEIDREIRRGPNDILGFRNHDVPNVADVLCVGDSQTYGNNAFLEENWPSRLEALVADRHARHYSMAVGGWGALEYLEILKTAGLLFRPRVVVVAFYSGNDAIESFTRIYGNELWGVLRPDPSLTADDAPPMAPNPPRPGDEWAVTFPDGVRTTFTPTLRWVSNRPHPAVAAGYEIMARAAETIGVGMRQAAGQDGRFESNDVQVVFTIIPTKELVYANKVNASGLKAPQQYLDLVRDEGRNIEVLRARLEAVPGARYSDVVGSMQQAAMGATMLYPEGPNGHPIAAGYDRIAQALAPVVRGYLPESPRILWEQAQDGSGRRDLVLLADKRHTFISPEIAEGSGWNLSRVGVASERDLMGRPRGEPIGKVNSRRFSPAAFGLH